MKICIVGISGSGKTTYAAYLNKKYKLTVYSSDYIKYVQKIGQRGRKKRSATDFDKIINKICQSDNWVYEGTQLVLPLLDSCDQIFWLKINRFTALYRQWKRFFTDKKQRQEHGFINNLRLSKKIILLDFQATSSATKIGNYYSNLDNVLEKFSSKTSVTENRKNLILLKF